LAIDPSPAPVPSSLDAVPAWVQMHLQNDSRLRRGLREGEDVTRENKQGAFSGNHRNQG
jgi:hypothetical protein